MHALTGEAHEIAAAYFYGFVCHYALDSEVHPYVYCRQEQIRAADAKLSASAVHCQIESDIDYLLYERVHHAPVTEFEPALHYTLSAEEKAVLAALLHAVLRTVYAAEVSTRDLRRSFDEMLAWETFLYSDSRAVYRGAQRLERMARPRRAADRPHEGRAPGLGRAQRAARTLAQPVAAGGAAHRVRARAVRLARIRAGRARRAVCRPV